MQYIATEIQQQRFTSVVSTIITVFNTMLVPSINLLISSLCIFPRQITNGLVYMHLLRTTA